MIHELIVTSAPRGLQTSRSGFTTVLQTRGVHPELARRLEAASAYRHVFAQGDPRNPVIRSHIVVQSPAGPVSVISRIVDAGNGYDGRSNKLAHHVAFDAVEVAARARSSPAAALLALERANAFLRVWEGEPREQPAGPFVPPALAEPAPCGLWLQAAGDAGWAGVLADRALRREPTWIIAPPGVDLVALFGEALALVNYQQRWGVTFTSYALSSGDALWLGTADGSPESQAARGQSRVAVVDLARPKPLETDSPLIAAARGTAPVPWQREAPGKGGAAGPAASGGSTQPPPLGAMSGLRPPPVGGRPPTVYAGVPASDRFGGDPSEGVPTPSADGDDGGETRRHPLVTGIIALGVVTLLLSATATVTVLLFPQILAEWNEPWSGRAGNSGPPQPEGPAVAGQGPTTPATEAPPADPPKREEPPNLGTRAAAAAAQAEAQADVAVQKVAKEMQKPLARVSELCTMIEALAKTAEEAAQEAKSPGEAVAEAAEHKAAFDEEMGGVAVIADAGRKAGEQAEAAADMVRGLAAEAGKVCNETKRALDELRNVAPGDAKIPVLKAAYDDGLKVLKAAEAAQKRAEAAEDKAQQELAKLEQWTVQRVNFEMRVAAAEVRMQDAARSMTETGTAFASLQARLEADKHVPREGLDAAVAQGQTKVLCEIGAARVGLKLPSEAVATATGAGWALACTSGTASARWDVSAQRAGSQESVTLGDVSINEKQMLVIRLFERTEQNAVARTALASAVLQVSDASDPSRTTYVQLCQPVQRRPLEWKRFLDGMGDGAKKTYRPTCPIDVQLPFDAWPATVVLSASCGQLAAEMLPDAPGPQSLANAGFTGRPITWSMRWAWNNEPVLRTDFAMGNKTSGAETRVIGATLEDPWGSRARLGYLNEDKEEGTRKFRGLPKVDEFEKQTRDVSVAMMQPLVRELFAKLRAGREQRIPDTSASTKLVDEVARIAPELPNEPQSTSEPQNDQKSTPEKATAHKSLAHWREGARKGLKESSPYKAWVSSTFQVGPEPDPKREPEAHEEWLRKKSKHDEAMAAVDERVAAYRAGLAQRLRSEDQRTANEACGEWREALLCDWMTTLGDVNEGKEETKKLLEHACGYVFPEKPKDRKNLKEGSPTATFTGEIFVEFKSVGGRCVLLTFEPAPPAPPGPPFPAPQGPDFNEGEAGGGGGPGNPR